ncbi:Hypothetical predicted protein [Paramuricea clavata]|uniref:Uncharacterized protein n=1 Tax=Paramuricea clavata TaxID=317549 RepID=A0A7D9D7P5_PARCT|nr:Hypothetical predicted protein [Paramuricea clavata]
MSPNVAINELWKSTSNSKNIQYDIYHSTKRVLKDFRSGQEHRLRNHVKDPLHQYYKVLSFPTDETLVYNSIKPAEKYIQLYCTIY